MVLVQHELKNAYIGEAPYEWDELCFTANNANSTIKLKVTYWTPTVVTLEKSSDWRNWSTYTIWNTITLTNVWDKVYLRNTSTTDTRFNKDVSNYYQFVMTWSISASWDINYLLNKNSTTTVSNYCYFALFNGCSALTTTPTLPATTVAEACYSQMFYECTNLTTLSALPAITLAKACYANMFNGCSKIKLSSTQTWSYQTQYRIPTTWTGSVWTNSLVNMFASTWWTFTGTPSINTTYYTSNTVE